MNHKPRRFCCHLSNHAFSVPIAALTPDKSPHFLSLPISLSLSLYPVIRHPGRGCIPAGDGETSGKRNVYLMCISKNIVDRRFQSTESPNLKLQNSVHVDFLLYLTLHTVAHLIFPESQLCTCISPEVSSFKCACICTGIYAREQDHRQRRAWAARKLLQQRHHCRCRAGLQDPIRHH